MRREAARLRSAAAQHGDCGKAIASRLARRPGRAADLVADCLAHGGALTHRYSATALRRAFTRLTPEQRGETRCEVGIASQHNARSRRTLHRTPARPITPIQAHYSVLDREKLPTDVPKARVQSLIAYENRDGAGLDAEGTRRIGEDMWAFRSPTGLCSALELPTAAVIACTDDTHMTGVQTPLTRVPGGVALWGTVADGITDMRLLDHGGRWRTVATPDNGVKVTTKLAPRLLTWRDGAGTTHYSDFSASVCLPGTPCPGPPPVSRRR